MLYTGVIGVVTLVSTYVLLLLSGLELHYLFTNNPAIFAALWLVVLAGLWLNDVVVPAHRGRERLLTRLEDMVLLPQV